MENIVCTEMGARYTDLNDQSVWTMSFFDSPKSLNFCNKLVESFPFENDEHCYYIQCSSGLDFILPTHKKIYTYRGQGVYEWKFVKDIEIFDQICIGLSEFNETHKNYLEEGKSIQPEQLFERLFSSTSRKEQFSILIGYIVSHANFTEHSISIEMKEATLFLKVCIVHGLFCLISNGTIFFSGPSCSILYNYVDKFYTSYKLPFKSMELVSVHRTPLDLGILNYQDFYIPFSFNMILNGVIVH